MCFKSFNPIFVTNNNFLNNYAKVTAAAGNAYAKGGAIFTNYDLTLNADNGTSLISGNYTETNGVKDQNAIYVANLADSSGTIQRKTTFTLNAVNNGKIQIDDKIAGGSYYTDDSSIVTFWETSDHAYSLALTGDSTGTISLYNDVTNANVTAQNVTVDFANSSIGGVSTVSTDTKIQIIQNNNSSSTLQLALSDALLDLAVDDALSGLTDTVSNTDQFQQSGGFGLGTTNTTNDSIVFYQPKNADTLDLITTKTSNNERSFNFTTADTYTVTKDLGTATAGTLNINGQSAGSTINAANHTMFNLANATTLNINDTTIENAKDYAINATHTNAVVNLTNTSIKNTQGTGIISNIDLNITADGGKSEFTGNTTAIEITAADKTITMTAQNKGEITLGDKITGTAPYELILRSDDTSKISINNSIENANIVLDNTNLYLNDETNFNTSNSLTLNSGTINLNNDKIGTMHLPTLNLAGTTNLSLDVDLANESMDRITADTYTITPDAILNVNNLTLISTTEKESVKILFADEQLANNVKYTGESPTS